jgi:hypothetical protein
MRDLTRRLERLEKEETRRIVLLWQGERSAEEMLPEVAAHTGANVICLRWGDDAAREEAARVLRGKGS